jgi:hypothetical protein
MRELTSAYLDTASSRYPGDASAAGDEVLDVHFDLVGIDLVCWPFLRCATERSAG